MKLFSSKSIIVSFYSIDFKIYIEGTKYNNGYKDIRQTIV